MDLLIDAADEAHSQMEYDSADSDEMSSSSSDVIEIDPSTDSAVTSRRGMKRKLIDDNSMNANCAINSNNGISSTFFSKTTTTTTRSDQMLKIEVEYEFVAATTNGPDTAFLGDMEIEMEPAMGEGCFQESMVDGFAERNYIVDEAEDSDSDLEIVDEVIYSKGGVEIEEIGEPESASSQYTDDEEPCCSKDADKVRGI